MIEVPHRAHIEADDTLFCPIQPKQKNEPAAGRRYDPEAVTVQKAG
ncbi:hypothetical protein HNQ77_002048 [Silvibacterium bohemicum]|uniref:Uncharacterized protein n=1 Tax=Silvibacterium bohemicum TaxID=1577686 RepID=A0A841JS05_9BACT|nr:hypothetical protein [Silvibacterium bohemicum]